MNVRTLMWFVISIAIFYTVIVVAVTATHQLKDEVTPPVVAAPPAPHRLHEECIGGIVYYAFPVSGGAEFFVSMTPKINPETLTFVRCELAPNDRK